MKLGADALVAIMGDEDTVTGFLLAGIGDMDQTRQPNFLIVDSSESSAITKFLTLYRSGFSSNRRNI
jgi:V-type H+-transporting ATPase subunit F